MQNYEINELFSQGEAVVFCGAGISLEPPAGLPNWQKLRDYTLEAVAAREKSLANHLSTLTELEMFGGMTPEVVASYIARYCRGYFQCFQSLEQGLANSNHQSLARLARLGHLRYIVTTNFDLFIEKALKGEGVDYQVYTSNKDFSRFDRNRDKYPVHLFKLHGCLSNPLAITATVEQQARGMAREKRAVVEWLLEHYFLVFWGYSGADLKLDLDYLRMVSREKTARGFVWNFLPGEAAHPQVEELVELYGKRGQIVYGYFAEVLEKILPTGEITRTQYAPEEEQEWGESCNAALRKSLAIWGERHVSAAKACRIFGGLLRHSGKLPASLQCYQRCQELHNHDKKTASVIQVLHELSDIHSQLADYDQAQARLQQALELSRAVWDKQSEIASLNKLGDLYLRRGDNQQALEEFKQALELNRRLQKSKQVEEHYRPIGRAYQALGDSDKALRFFYKARKAHAAVDNRSELASDLQCIASIFEQREQYPEAIDYLHKAREALEYLGDKRAIVAVLTAIGKNLRQAEDLEAAIVTYSQALNTAQAISDNQAAATIADTLADVMQKGGEQQESLKYRQQAKQIRNSL